MEVGNNLIPQIPDIPVTRQSFKQVKDDLLVCGAKEVLLLQLLLSQPPQILHKQPGFFVPVVKTDTLSPHSLMRKS